MVVTARLFLQQVLFVGMMIRIAGSFLIRLNNPTTARFFPPSASRRMATASVTGTVYETKEDGPIVTLFTKEGCTLCDKVKDVLVAVSEECPHSLHQKDITDDSDLYERYKYDIPVLHLDGQYWAKHRLTIDEARAALQRAREGTFQSPPGEPNAGKMERKKGVDV